MFVGCSYGEYLGLLFTVWKKSHIGVVSVRDNVKSSSESKSEFAESSHVRGFLTPPPPPRRLLTLAREKANLL